MTRRLILSAEAEEDIYEAAAWYEPRRRGLSSEFLDAVDRAIETVRAFPLRHPVVFGRVRQFVLRRFPYSVLYTATDEEVVVLACFHHRRDPAEWESRV